jgi:hypothetical protein
MPSRRAASSTLARVAPPSDAFSSASNILFLWTSIWRVTGRCKKCEYTAQWENRCSRTERQEGTEEQCSERYCERLVIFRPPCWFPDIWTYAKRGVGMRR